jgi:hypothetical protein
MLDLASNYKCDYLSDEGILVKNYYGIITIKDIRDTWEDAISNRLIPEDVKGFVLDYSKASFGIRIEEYIEIPNFYKDHLEIFANTKIAIVTQNSEDIVIPILAAKEDFGYLSRPFSTIEAAIKWISN